MTEAVIVAAGRSPIGRAHKGSLVSLRPDDLASQVVRSVLRQVPEVAMSEVDDLLLGCAQPSGEAGFNLARIVAVLCGTDGLPGTTVNRFCASSLQTVRMAMHAIKAGEGRAFIAGGVEAVSRYTDDREERLKARNPAFEPAQARTAAMVAERRPWSDPRHLGELPDAYIAMGLTAEYVAAQRGITREEQDVFALRSQRLTAEATEAGFWSREIHPVRLPDGTLVDSDDSPRPSTDLDGLAALEPVFRPDGTVTAGNCCPLNDGAAALMIMAHDFALERSVRPLARVVATGVSGLSPEIMGLGPVEASRRALSAAGMTMEDVDLVEINEAFAAQVLPSARDLGVDLDRLNVHGGAIALGHPFGMSGARLIGTLLNSLEVRDQEVGLAAMCVGGGQGMAVIVERLR